MTWAVVRASTSWFCIGHLLGSDGARSDDYPSGHGRLFAISRDIRRARPVSKYGGVMLAGESSRSLFALRPLNFACGRWGAAPRASPPPSPRHRRSASRASEPHGPITGQDAPASQTQTLSVEVWQLSVLAPAFTPVRSLRKLSVLTTMFPVIVLGKPGRLRTCSWAC
jgi:hypothetical protein